jgi:orotidine-5'-phosphate decarboxylase
MDQTRLAQVGIRDSVESQVVRLAQVAQMSGLHGVMASPHEVAAIKRTCGATFITAVSGVRPTWAATGDQQRVLTPAEALRRGADYLIIGRPITAAPHGIGGPAAAAERIAAELGG